MRYLVSDTAYCGFHGATVYSTKEEAEELYGVLYSRYTMGLSVEPQLLVDTTENRARFDFIRG